MELGTVLSILSSTIGGEVDADAPLMEAGLDSLGAVELKNRLQEEAGDEQLPSTLVFDHPTARQLTDVFVKQAARAQPPRPSASAALPVRDSTSCQMSGAAALLPSGARNVGMLWNMTAHGYDAISPVPTARWSEAELDQHQVPPDVRKRMTNAGFLRDPEWFDNRFFKMGAAEAVVMDPQQRLLLEQSYRASY